MYIPATVHHVAVGEDTSELSEDGSGTPKLINLTIPGHLLLGGKAGLQT